jgi:hypothetical protein
VKRGAGELAQVGVTRHLRERLDQARLSELGKTILIRKVARNHKCLMGKGLRFSFVQFFRL